MKRKTVSFRVSEEEKLHIQTEAKRLHKTVNDYLRDSVLSNPIYSQLRDQENQYKQILAEAGEEQMRRFEKQMETMFNELEKFLTGEGAYRPKTYLEELFEQTK